MMRRIVKPDPMPKAAARAARGNGEPPATIVALAHCEPLLGPFLGWAAALALHGSLPRRDHELLALRTAHNCGSPFEWREHRAWARAADLSDAEIERVAIGSEAEGWTPAEAALLNAADDLHTTFTISDRTWTSLLSHYDTGQLIEAAYIVGQYTMLSMVANAIEAE